MIIDLDAIEEILNHDERRWHVSPAAVAQLVAEVRALREDAERYRWAIAGDDNAEALYAAVVSCGPSAAKSINIEIDHARAEEKS